MGTLISYAGAVTAIVNERNWTLPLGLFRTTFTLFSYRVRSGVSLYKAPQDAAISHFLSHPPTRPTHGEIDATPGTTFPTRFRQVQVYLVFQGP